MGMEFVLKTTHAAVTWDSLEPDAMKPVSMIYQKKCFCSFFSSFQSRFNIK